MDILFERLAEKKRARRLYIFGICHGILFTACIGAVILYALSEAHPNLLPF